MERLSVLVSCGAVVCATGAFKQHDEHSFKNALDRVKSQSWFAARDGSDQIYLLRTFLSRDFNAVQSECFDAAFRQEHNLVVSAPTGTGKTAIFELAICRLLMQLSLKRCEPLEALASPLGVKVMYVSS